MKICGVTDEAGIARGGRGRGRRDRAQPGAGDAARAEPRRGGRAREVRPHASPRPAAGPRIVAITLDLAAEDLSTIVAAVDPDVVQLSGDEPPGAVRAVGRPAWKSIPVGAGADPASIVARAREYLAAGAERVLLDAAGGVFPGGTGIRIAPTTASAVAREVPVILAGGLGPANVADALLRTAAVGVDVASGVEAAATRR